MIKCQFDKSVKVRRSDVAPEQLGRGCNKEVGRSDIASEPLGRGQ
ncbi:hypothetical protein MANES_02G221261v8 [Manihot esculenta]|uniref:Uncharacterized protein n=1 Tax=Manihot esculenta TaxID=3983 RepID=A0ACB7IA11_MANES|nr:hypothetical protein MANES_02G221261v8 [Manihot esculenta]